MANPTTNFGWVMPTSSSLVTNLPADFNTFGQAVDTSMSELLGGTTGQVLSKTSNTSMDFTWVTPTDQTPLTTKGDLFTFTTVDARIGVGTDGQVLTASSAAATGLAWTTVSSTPTASACQAKRATDQTISNNTLTVLTFDAEDFDTSSYHSLVTNTERLTVPSTGYYLINAQVMFATNASGYRQLGIFKNGTRLNYATATAATSATEATIIFNLMVSLTAADYLEIKVQQNSGGSLAVYGDSSNTRGTLFGITYLGA